MKKKKTNVMAELHQAEFIYRSLLLPQKTPSGSGADTTVRLRHTLAKDGCKDSQIALAKYLLTVVSNCPEERDFNTHSAIYWLLQAVKTGQEEAFLLLEDCFKTGVGINAVNCSEVEKCLKFSEQEKLARRIAFSIYRTTMSDTEELILSDIFSDKIELLSQRKEAEILRDESKENSSQVIPESLCQTKSDESNLQNQKCVSFSEVVSSVQTCLEGNVPLVSLKQAMNYSEYKSWLSTKYLHIVLDLSMKSLESLICNLSSLRISVSIILMILLSFLSVSLFPGNQLYQLIQKYDIWLKSSFCLIIMLSCTCFIINVSFEGDNLKRWLHLIKYFEPNVKSKDIQRKYFSKTTYPLLTFFFASFFYFAFLPNSAISAAYTDIGFLSFFLMILVDRTIDSKRYYVNISLFLNILNCLYKANIIQGSFGNIALQFDYLLAKNLYLHINFISCLALPFVLPYVYFKMGKGSRSWHLVLLPHLMSLTWMNLACIHLSSTSSSQQLLSILSWFIILLMSNYAGFLFTLILYCLVIASKAQDFFKIDLLIFGLVFVILYCISLIIIRKLKFSHESKIWSLIVCFFILALSFQTFEPSNTDPTNTTIPWDKYQSFCHHNAWYKTNTAEVQISCLPLKGRDIALEGTVTSIDLIQVHNNLQTFANMLPKPLNSWFICTLGQNYELCNSSEITPFEKERCKMYGSLNLSRCHLHNWDTYVYQITVEISSRTSPEILLIADHGCTSFVKTLKEGDNLEATATLDLNIGGAKPVLTLKKSHCASCYVNRECSISSMPSVPSHTKFSWQNVVWFYFSPLIRYNSG